MALSQLCRPRPDRIPQEAADRVVKQTLGGSRSKMDLIYSKEHFTEEFATVLNKDSGLSSADFDVLLLYLSRDIGAIAYDGKVGCDPCTCMGTY